MSGVPSSAEPSTLWGNVEAVPMDQFGAVGVVEDIKGYRFAFRHAQQRPGS
jgi:hypothetical protein